MKRLIYFSQHAFHEAHRIPTFCCQQSTQCRSSASRFFFVCSISTNSFRVIISKPKHTLNHIVCKLHTVYEKKKKRCAAVILDGQYSTHRKTLTPSCRISFFHRLTTRFNQVVNYAIFFVLCFTVQCDFCLSTSQLLLRHFVRKK